MKNRRNYVLRYGKDLKRGITLLLTLLLGVSLASIMSILFSKNVYASVTKPSAPAITKSTEEGVGNITTWSCIYLGRYIQSEVTEKHRIWNEISKLKNTAWNTNGDTTYKNVKYHRVFIKETTLDSKTNKYITKNVPHYYQVEPIKWRVLSISGNDAFVMADRALDCQPYNVTEGSQSTLAVTWKNSTLRSWLNGYGSTENAREKDYSRQNFMKTAFSAAEQAIIKPTTVRGQTNPETGVSDGSVAVDKIFILSATELTTKAYGFDTVFDGSAGNTLSDEKATPSRLCANTDYATLLGAANGGNLSVNKRFDTGWYWVRMPGKDGTMSSFISAMGNGTYDGTINSLTVFGVRPAMHINLGTSSSKTLWQYAGTVNSLGEANEPAGSGTGGGFGGGSGTSIDGTKLPDAGTRITDSKGRKYRILTSTAKSKTVEFTGVQRHEKKLTIPASIKYSGYTYKVVSINTKAMKGDRKLTTLTIGKNVKNIGRQAFYGCKKLKTITIKTSQLTSKSVKKKSFKGIAKRAKIKVPGKKIKSYKKLFRARGVSGKAKILK